MLNKTDKKLFSERQRRIYNFINNNRIGVLASVDPNGEPSGTVIYHTVDKEFNVSFITKKGTKKYDNLIRNNHVVYVIFESKSQTVAQVIGQAVEIKETYDINAVAASVFATSIKTSKAGILPAAKLNAGEYKAFRIIPKQIRMASYAHPDSGDYDKIFESIESFELKVHED